MTALTRQIPGTIFLLRELDATVDQILNSLGRMLTNLMHNLGLPKPGTCNHGIACMLIKGILWIHHTTYATLSKV